MIAGPGAHIHLNGIVDDAASLRPPVVEIAPRFQGRRITLAHIGLGTRGILLERGEITDVIEMPVRRGYDLNVARLEAERFDIRLDERIRSRRAGVDKDE